MTTSALVNGLRAVEAALPDPGLPADDPGHVGPTVSVVLTAPGADENGSPAQRLEWVTNYRNLEFLTLDTAPGGSLAERVNHMARSASGELLLLLDPAVEPVRPDWLTRLVRLLDSDDVSATGPLLLRGRRAGRSPFDDLGIRVKSAGIGFEIAGGRVRPTDIDSGRRPFTPWCRGQRDVPALSEFCLLTRTRHLRSLGGLDTRYTLVGTGWDLSLRLGRFGRLVMDAGAPLLCMGDTSESPVPGGNLRQIRRRDNATFNAVWGGALHRGILQEHLGSAVGLTGPAASTFRIGGPGSPAVRELADALAELGWVPAPDDESPVLELTDAAPGRPPAQPPAALTVALTSATECEPSRQDSVVVGLGGIVPAVRDRPALSVPAGSGDQIDPNAVLDALRTFVARPRFAIRSRGPNRQSGASQQYAALASSLAAALSRAGMSADIHPRGRWEAPRAHPYDVVVHLRGPDRYEPRGAVNVLWLLGHASGASSEELDAYDLVLATDAAHGEKVRTQTSTRVEPLDPVADLDASVSALLDYLAPVP